MASGGSGSGPDRKENLQEEDHPNLETSSDEGDNENTERHPAGTRARVPSGDKGLRGRRGSPFVMPKQTSRSEEMSHRSVSDINEHSQTPNDQARFEAKLPPPKETWNSGRGERGRGRRGGRGGNSRQFHKSMEDLGDSDDSNTVFDTVSNESENRGQGKRKRNYRRRRSNRGQWRNNDGPGISHTDSAEGAFGNMSGNVGDERNYNQSRRQEPGHWTESEEARRYQQNDSEASISPRDEDWTRGRGGRGSERRGKPFYKSVENLYAPRESHRDAPNEYQHNGRRMERGRGYQRGRPERGQWRYRDGSEEGFERHVRYAWNGGGVENGRNFPGGGEEWGQWRDNAEQAEYETNMSQQRKNWPRGRGGREGGREGGRGRRSGEEFIRGDDSRTDNATNKWEYRGQGRQRGREDYQIERSEHGQWRGNNDVNLNEQINSDANIPFQEENWTRGRGARGRGRSRIPFSRSVEDLCDADDSNTENVTYHYKNRGRGFDRGRNDQGGKSDRGYRRGRGRGYGFLNKKVRELEEKLAQVLASPKVCTDKLEITAWQAELLSHCFGTFEECHVHFNNTENVAVFDGPEDKVKQRQLDLLQQLKDIKESQFALTPGTLSVLNSEKGKAYLKKILDSETKDIMSLIQDECLLVASKENDVLIAGIDTLEQSLNYKETITSDSEVSLDKLKTLQAKLERNLLVSISWNENGKEIYLDGIKDDVLTSAGYVNEVVEECKLHEKSFQINGSEARYIHRYLGDRIHNLLSDVKIIKSLSCDDQIDLQFRGTKSQTEEVRKKLKDLITHLTVKTWDLKLGFKNKEDLMLVIHGFKSEELMEKIENFENREKCLVIAKLPSISVPAADSPKEVQQDRSISSPILATMPVAHTSPAKTPKAKLTFSITGTCRLVIKSYGDITKEKSDILVCVLDKTSMDLNKTSVGQAFNRVCPSLRNSLEQHRAANTPIDSVLTTTGPFPLLKCQAIFHVLFLPWDPKASPSCLISAMRTILAHASALGAKSVSFPAMGYGRAFGFPASSVATNCLSCLPLGKFLNSLEKLIFLAPEVELFKEFQSQAQKLFPPFKPPKDKCLHSQASADAMPNFSLQSAVSGAVGVTPLNPLLSRVQKFETAGASEDSEKDDESWIPTLTDDAHIRIVAMDGKPLNEMWSALKEIIKKVCLYTDDFNQHVDNWPKESRFRILKEALKLGIWIKLSLGPDSKKPRYIIKGTQMNVNKMKDFIHQEFLHFSTHLPTLRIKSDRAPKRGTVEFMKHAAMSDELFPSYWKLNQSQDILQKAKETVSGSNKPTILVNVDSKTKAAIIRLINKTWDPNLVGHGADAQGLQHSDIKVISVQRVENVSLFETYKMQRKRLFEKMCALKQIYPDIGKLQGSKGRVQTTEILEDFMKEELYWEVNEHYLFHGTKETFIKALMVNGIDPKVTSPKAMFGRGIYAAEKFTKSDQYTDSRDNRSSRGNELYMILARVLLGNVFLCNSKHPTVAARDGEKLSRPPCMRCLQDKCGCGSMHFDSVMGDGKWLFREFVVYEMSQCYPEYVIKYQRV